MSADDDLAAMVRTMIREELAKQTTQIMTVSAVREDGLVNLAWGDAIIDGVGANASYSPRKAGDVVMVQQSAAGWRVIDRIGSPSEAQIPDGVQLTFGPNQPTGSYAQATAVWVGENQLYVQTGSGPGGPTDPPNASKPKPVSLDPSWRQGYRNGRKDSQRIAQGASPEYPRPWTAVWGFGSQIEDACAGKTVAKMEIRLARTSKAHGTKKSVRAKLGLVTNSSAPSSTPSLSSRWTGPGLEWGESEWETIPAAQAARLASGDARGIAASAPVSDYSYIVFTAGSGNLKISFSS